MAGPANHLGTFQTALVATGGASKPSHHINPARTEVRFNASLMYDCELNPSHIIAVGWLVRWLIGSSTFGLRSSPRL